MCKKFFEPKILVPWDQILNFLALRPNAGPTQTHAGCGLTPYDFLAHADHVLFEDYFFVFRSILQRCAPHTCINYEYLQILSELLSFEILMKSTKFTKNIGTIHSIPTALSSNSMETFLRYDRGRALNAGPPLWFQQWSISSKGSW